jgi:hypothetical protein
LEGQALDVVVELLQAAAGPVGPDAGRWFAFVLWSVRWCASTGSNQSDGVTRRRNGPVGLSSLADPFSNTRSIPWFGGDLARPELGPADRSAAEQCAELLGVDLATVHELATKVEPYIRVDGASIWSLMQLERQLRPEAYDRRRGGYSTADGSRLPMPNQSGRRRCGRAVKFYGPSVELSSDLLHAIYGPAAPSRPMEPLSWDTEYPLITVVDRC